MGSATTTVPGRSEPRIKYKERTVDGILSYDIDNAYPQRVAYTIAASGTASSCAELHRDYTAGLGFRDEAFGGLIVNRYGITANALLLKVAQDVNFLGYGLIALVYNGLGKVAEWLYVPAEFGRWKIPNKATEQVEQVAIHFDWNCQKDKRFDQKKIQFLDLFNPDPEVIQNQIAAAGGLQNWKGQIFVVTEATLPEYPLAPCDPVLMDVQTDGLIQVFKNRTVTKGFMPNGIFGHPGKFESQEKREEFIEALEEYQGAENSNSVILCEFETPELKPEWLPMTFPDVDKVFQFTEQTVKENIRERYKVPPILLTAKDKSGVSIGESKELENAQLYFDKLKAPTRKLISEAFTKLGPASIFQAPKPENGYAIMSIGESITTAGSYIYKTLGPDAVKGIMEIVNGSQPRDQKVALIVEIYGLDAERVKKMVPEPVQTTTTTTPEQNPAQP